MGLIVVHMPGSRYHGVWYERLDAAPPPITQIPDTWATVTLEPTGRFVRRDDGVTAELWAVGGPTCPTLDEWASETGQAEHIDMTSLWRP